MREIFPETQSIKSFEFSDVHKAVLGILPVKLDLILLLLTWRSQVTFTDAWGRTPLHWASRRGDIAAIKALIPCGAHLDIRDKNRSAALHLAALTQSVAPIRLLLNVICSSYSTCLYFSRGHCQRLNRGFYHPNWD